MQIIDASQTQTAEHAHHEVPPITVNGVAINEAEVLAEMQYHPAEGKRQAMVSAAQALIINELLSQQAINEGLLTEQIDPHSSAYNDAINQLISRHAATPNAGDDECLRFYQQHPHKFTSSPLLEVRHILIAAADDDLVAQEQAQSIAKQLIEQLTEQPEQFAQLAMAHSSCPSKQQAGSLGQISKDQTVPEFEQVLFAADTGLIDFPVASRYGYHVVFIDRKVNGQQLPFEQVADNIKRYLQDKVNRKATAQYIQTLIQAANIQGFDFEIAESALLQ